ncbi:hypothetical protein [Pseudomonas vancouverensis]|uniref:Uncharacterized protein n=1 Tax=Pseudomonas vancouverensis TaxID=95300 RepID=A0A1H2MVU2_PSEVA|nr:hypothetical protein [Pseudomonas vancouverensis]KAB0489689.1 hypothetical protein F7R09_28645 [Pseudomonas vancouverensis]TDB67185.1 hypothetical protein EIY72_03815 [Pseudomonas vancouverensis]SDU97045.1 hypothetical protein SAMN05216558_1313 [Pseudomonas vancouverensis]
MASKVLKSFLIGIGYDTKALDAGDKKINASLNGIKSNALGISAALVGAFGAGAGAIVGVANRVDKLAMSTQNLRTSQAAVYNYGNALKLMGGDAADAVETLAHFEEIQNNLRLKGDAGPINDLATAGIDVSSLYKTSTGEEFMRALASMIPNLDEGQRAQVQSSLGLSDGVFRSLAGGVDKLDDAMKRASGLTGSVDQLTDNARKLAENSAEFSLILEGINNELSEKFMKSLVGAGSALNNFLKDHRESVSGVIDYASDNPVATATLGTSAVAAVVGATFAKLGLASIGGLVSKTGTAGVAITGGAIGSNLINRSLNEYVPGYGDAARGFDELLKDVTGLDRIKGPMELMYGGDGNATQSRSDIRYEKPQEYTGKVIRSQKDIDYLNRRDEPPVEVSRPAESVYGERSAADIIPPAEATSREDERNANADALAGALSRTPIKVQNQLGVTLQLDGQALESKITQVNERQNYETLGDLKTTTER